MLEYPLISAKYSMKKTSLIVLEEKRYSSNEYIIEEDEVFFKPADIKKQLQERKSMFS